jgi:alanine dehydrogenase
VPVEASVGTTPSSGIWLPAACRAGKTTSRSPFTINSGNQGLQLSSTGGLGYHKGKAAGRGREIPTEWFLQDIRD